MVLLPCMALKLEMLEQSEYLAVYVRIPFFIASAW